MLWAALHGGPGGGIPSARVAIGTRPPASAAPPDAVPASPGARSGPSSATAVETASGVSVVRPDGSTAPGSILIRVPDEAVPLPPIDPKLTEQSRFGPLPRVAADGTRPLDAYARPGGRDPVGARIAIVVGGLGIGQSTTQEAIGRLPAGITLAFAPYGAGVDRMAEAARADGHEIMLQVPMEPFDYPDSDPGPHTLKAAARPAENIDHLQWAMGRIGGYVGIVNYMGGKITADEKAMAPVLKEIGGRGLAFLDDGSSSRSVVTGGRGPAPVARAGAVLDAVPRADAIDKALARLEEQAAGGVLAIATASALPLTVSRIERWTRELDARGIRLVPVSAAFPRGASGEASR